MNKYVIGLDYGSLSGRALLVDVVTGEAVAESVMEYAHGVMTDCLPDGTPLPKDSAVQHPEDYLAVLRTTIREVMKIGGVSPQQVIGIGVDFTASTILPVDKNLIPLCMQPDFESHPKAYVTMWKDHTAAPCAELIDRVAQERHEPFWAHTGYKCSAENGLAKMLSILQTDQAVYDEAHRILEAGDWITMLLTGTDKKGFNMACCKEFWNREWGGYPSKSFMGALDPRFESVVEEKLGGDTVSYDSCFGIVTAAGAELSGLLEGTPVAMPMIDGYAPFPACGVTGPDRMVLSVGTSLCHIMCSELKKDIPGVFASYCDGLYEGLTTYEFGQSGCGDILAWYVENCLPASYEEEAAVSGISIHQLLTDKLSDTRPGQSGLLCLDWLNGNRSILNDAELTGMILGLTILTKPEEIYRALMEGIVFGTRRIMDAMDEGGLTVEEIVACGGIAHKNAFMMQMFADVTNRRIRICASKQAPALASAMYAAVAAGPKKGGYASLKEAASVMARLSDTVYEPDRQMHALYERLYREYRFLYHEFGEKNGVMKRLKDIRDSVIALS